MTSISVIIPALNEEAVLALTLAALARGDTGGRCEPIVVDGGSTDATASIARAAGAKVIESPRGRGRQMNSGAAGAAGDILLFLHADTMLPADFPQLIEQALSGPGIAGGAFSLGIDSPAKSLAAIAGLANLRSRLLRLPYGDQALFTTREMFAAAGGFPELPIMEDFVFVRRLGKLGKISILPARAITSARRWQNMGVIRTTLINQVIVGGYCLGVPPTTLAGWYRRLRGLGRS